MQIIIVSITHLIITFMRKVIYLFVLVSISCYGQTQRDTLVSEIIYNLPKDETAYTKLKADIKELEKSEEKPNPEILHSKLEYIYQQNDIDYFKEVLTLLTRNYGFNLSYASGNESYYEDIINGNLATWFKEMYIKNHSEWLSENLDKQIDIYRLNTLFEKDQLVNGVFRDFYSNLNLSEKQEEASFKMLGSHFYDNAKVIESVASKTGSMPRGNSFALIQNGYGIVELHCLQNKYTYEKLWTTFYPYYKTSYLNMDISSITFRNIDSQMYIHEGKQIFDLLKIEDIPKHWLKNPNDKDIPLKDELETKKMRTELGWE